MGRGAAELRGREWVSERELRGLPGWRVPVVWAAHRGQHRPDVGIVVGGGRVAVEVELSHKSPRRLAAILAGYADAIAGGAIAGGLIYVSDRADVLEAVDRAARRAALPPRRFRIRELADVQAEVRALTVAGRECANAEATLRPADARGNAGVSARDGAQGEGDRADGREVRR